jgi:hypothetical protein
MEAERHYPIETFDPLLRDLVGWGLVERRDTEAGAPWQLVPNAQQRLDELLGPARVSGIGADIFVNRLCGDCHQRRVTRLRGERYVCDRCWMDRQEAPAVVVTEPAPVGHAHRWRRTRPGEATPLAG